MLKAVELLRQGKHEELWQMCCGYLKLDIGEFMDIQERLLLEQLELLNKSPLGNKIMKGAEPRTLAEFREMVPLTTYADYCPELVEKREDILPVEPSLWAHSSGRSGEYPCKWVPISQKFKHELSVALYGVGVLSCSNSWVDTSHIPKNIKILYSVAPRPYISGVFADALRMQTPITYMPDIEESESLPFEERIRLGFEQSISQGLDYFIGLSLVLASVGDKFLQSSDKVDLRPYLKKPKALWRLASGKLKSRLAGRPMLPRDVWSLKGIIGSGLDSWFYKDKIFEMWGRKPLDFYSCTEGGVIATQAWDYEGMTFIPNLNFLEFIPEDETLKWQMDSSYKPKTLLLNEVKAGECYELAFTNFHGGAMIRYRVGDLVKITSLRNENLGIELPQMAFERRVDDTVDFNVVRLTEKQIWQALENTGIAYQDWMAYRVPGQQDLHLMVELEGGQQIDEEGLAAEVYKNIIKADVNDFNTSSAFSNAMDMLGFNVEVRFLPKGTFSNYTKRKQEQGADLAHLKPPHLNPSHEVLTLLLPDVEEIIVVTKAKTGHIAAVEDTSEAQKVT